MDMTRNKTRCQETRCHACGQTSPSPQFVATMDLPHMNVQAGFWLRHRQLLRSKMIKLQGPTNAVMKVKVRKYCKDREFTYHLESGWVEFAHVNLLEIGDVLVFSMVAPSHFEVKVVDHN